MATSAAAHAGPIPHTVPLPGGIPDTHRPHTESTTTILVPKENTAFLNPVQQYNRDLSIACIRAWNEMRKEEAEVRWRRRMERIKKEGARGKGKGKAQKGGEGGEAAATAEEEVAEPAFRPSKFTILEALSATGLRSIRYAKEIPDVKYVQANDLSPSACDAMRMNVALNGVGEPMRKNGESSKSAAAPVVAGADADEEAASNCRLSEQEQMERIGRREGAKGFVKINEGDACALMYARRAPQARVDVVDLDPYGTAAPFVDAAIGCIADGGLLCVTCTDLAVLAGSQYPEKAFSNYGGVSVHAEYSHEVALRLVLSSLATAAARYGRYITPLLSFSIDFYVRLFVRVDTQPQEVKALASQIGAVYTCSFCQTPTPQPFGRVVSRDDKKGNPNKQYKTAQAANIQGSECGLCGGTLHLGGPMWLGPIQDTAFATRVLTGIEGQEDKYGTWARMHGMVALVQEELPDAFYFTPNKIHSMFRASSGPTAGVISALLNGGYKVSRSHAASGSIKTDAPREFVMDIVREYIKSAPVRVDKIPEGSPSRKLVEKPMTHTIDFTPHAGAKRWDRGEKVYYQANPTANWGPGSRARTAKSTAGAGLEILGAGAEVPTGKRKAEEGAAEGSGIAEEAAVEASEPKRAKVDGGAGGGTETAAAAEVQTAGEFDEESAMNA